MRPDPARESLWDDALIHIAELPPAEGLDVLLHFFLGTLHGLDLQTARQMHEELVHRFGGRHCRGQVCRMMAELVNGHLAGHPSAQNQPGRRQVIVA
jgi:hypothetical protein